MAWRISSIISGSGLGGPTVVYNYARRLVAAAEPYLSPWTALAEAIDSSSAMSSDWCPGWDTRRFLGDVPRPTQVETGKPFGL
ncbi:hypothetical protein H5410_049109 [Solanum commersonii]|uniref:Uncharacterized protein n=1 Tax=Solanum commersonii TaxID=4109 RepID=A0A9J5XK49_SOLCO|nr:hypothetical protein H5410_049109 [Solanum commersonii]